MKWSGKHTRHKHRKGGVLPVTIVAMLLVVLLLHTVISLAHNRMVHQHLSNQYYQGQTYLSYAQWFLQEQPETTHLVFREGTVNISRQSDGILLTVSLTTGHRDQLFLPQQPVERNRVESDATSLHATP